MGTENSIHKLSAGGKLSLASIGEPGIKFDASGSSGFQLNWQIRLLNKGNFNLRLGPSLYLLPFKGQRAQMPTDAYTPEDNQKAGILGWNFEKNGEFSCYLALSGSWFSGMIKNVGKFGFGALLGIGYSYLLGDIIISKDPNAASSGTTIDSTKYANMMNGFESHRFPFKVGIFLEYLIGNTPVSIFLKGTFDGSVPFGGTFKIAFLGSVSMDLGITLYFGKSAPDRIAQRLPEKRVPPPPRKVVKKPLPPKVQGLSQNDFQIFSEPFHAEKNLAQQAHLTAKEVAKSKNPTEEDITKAEKLLADAKAAVEKRKESESSIHQLSKEQRDELSKLILLSATYRQWAETDIGKAKQRLQKLNILAKLDALTKSALKDVKRALRFANKALKTATSDAEVAEDSRMKRVKSDAQRIIGEIGRLKDSIEDTAKKKQLDQLKKLRGDAKALNVKAKKLSEQADTIRRTI